MGDEDVEGLKSLRVKKEIVPTRFDTPPEATSHATAPRKTHSRGRKEKPTDQFPHGLNPLIFNLKFLI
jgi:hypothetical protein